MSEPTPAPPGPPGGDGAVPQQNTAPPNAPPPQGPERTQLMDVRDRLFHALFIKTALFYAMMFPRPFRRVIELVLFMKALLAFFSLVYIHYTFSMSPVPCLQQVADHWPRHGVLHIEINRHFPSHQRFMGGLQAPKGDVVEFSLPENPMRFDLLQKVPEGPAMEEILDEANYKNYRMYSVMESLLDTFKSRYANGVDSERVEPPVFQKDQGKEKGDNGVLGDSDPGERPAADAVVEVTVPKESVQEEEQQKTEGDTLSLFQEIAKSSNWLATVARQTEGEEEEEDQFIVEYSLEYGLLRLSNVTRERMNVPVLYVYLNPDTDKCFGDNLSRFILEKFLGYDDLLMAALRTLAEKEGNKGYLRNLVTGEHFRFISSWWVPRGSFVVAFFVMLLFTVTISMLLRYSHHQIFIFIVDLLRMLEFNISARFPAAPLLTVILALVGMEAIMSEFFNDTTTAFYVILIVWVADQFDAVCCHTNISKRHWLRFFYLYQYSFYAYHFRFNGQYSGLALVTAWLFIQHSMVYFLHHYELPMIIRQAQLQQIIIRNRGHGANPGGGAAAAAGATAPAGDQQQPTPGGSMAGAGNFNERNTYVVAYPANRAAHGPGNFIVNGLAGFRLPRLQQQRLNNNNNNNADAPNNNRVDGAGEGANNNNTAPSPPGNPGEDQRQAFVLPIIGNIRNIALTARRMVHGAGNNNNGPNVAAGDGGNAPAGPGGGGGSAAVHHHHHHQHQHHHHRHVHRRLPTIMNLAHLQRISLGRITISPQFTGAVNAQEGRTGDVATAAPAEGSGETGNGGTAAVVDQVENNGCNESEAPDQMAATAAVESVPEMESNARRQESDPSDDALAATSPMPSSMDEGGGTGDSIIEANSRDDKLLSKEDGAKDRGEGSIDKLNSVQVASKVNVAGISGVNSDQEVTAAAADTASVIDDQKTEERKCELGIVSSIVSDSSGTDNELPSLDQAHGGIRPDAFGRVADNQDEQEEEERSGEGYKLVNLNVNCNHLQQSSELSSDSIGGVRRRNTPSDEAERY